MNPIILLERKLWHEWHSFCHDTDDWMLFRPKYVHLTNEQFFETDTADIKDNIYDLSTNASSSSTTNTITTSQTALNRLMHEENVAKSHMEASESHHNGASTSKKTLKHSPSQQQHQHYTNSSNLVTVMMDDKSHDTEDHSFYMPLRRDLDNGHHPMEYEGNDIRLHLMSDSHLDSFLTFQIHRLTRSFRKLNVPTHQMISQRKKMRTFCAAQLSICNQSF